MSSPRVFIALPTSRRVARFAPEAWQRLCSFAEVTWNPKDAELTEEELSAFLKEADGIITDMGGGLTAQVVAKAPNLKIIGAMSSTVQYIPTDAALARGIAIVNAPQGSGLSVAEFTLALILASLRDIVGLHLMVKERKEWPRTQGTDLTGKKVGLIGVGTIARRLIELLQPFYVTIAAYDPYLPAEEAQQLGVRLTTLEDLLANSDVISIHCGATPESYHMLGKEQLGLIREGALLVNTARGKIVDEKALIEELERGRFQAALDVYETEPLPDDSELRHLPNVLLTPHRAGGTHETVTRHSLFLVEDFQRFFSGQRPRNYLTAEKIRTMHYAEKPR